MEKTLDLVDGRLERRVVTSLAERILGGTVPSAREVMAVVTGVPASGVPGVPMSGLPMSGLPM